MPPKSTRISASDPTLLDRKLVSTAAGALPVHSRVSVLCGKSWEQGLVTETHSCLNGSGKAVIMYRIAYDNGKEQETDLSTKDAKLVTSHIADTPRSQRKADVRAQAAAPLVGVTNIPSPSKLAELKVAEMRRMCSDLGLESKGTKKELTEVLARAHSAAQALLSGDVTAPPEAMAGDDGSNEDTVKALEAQVASLSEQLSTERAVSIDTRREALEQSKSVASLTAAIKVREEALSGVEAEAEALHKRVEAAEAETAHLRSLVVAMEEREGRLQAELHELKGSVRVLCRLRPPKKTGGQAAAEASGMMSSGITRSLTMRGVAPVGARETARTFDFDRVFDSDSRTEEVRASSTTLSPPPDHPRRHVSPTSDIAQSAASPSGFQRVCV